jgi:hypothetical protein
VQTNVAMRVEKVGDPLRLVAADVVADHVDFPAFGLAGDDIGQEGHELFAGVARHRLAQHFAGRSIERREQAERAVALVLEAVTLGAQATAAASGPCGRVPESRSSRPRRTPLRAPAGSDKARSHRPLWPQSPGRWRPCAARVVAA